LIKSFFGNIGFYKQFIFLFTQFPFEILLNISTIYYLSRKKQPTMKYRNFGNTGLKVSEIGFGAWAIGGSWGEQRESDSLQALETALDKGVNFIDTAAGYGDGKSERIIGEFLKSRPETVHICTKTPPAPGKWPPSPYCKVEDRYSEKYIRENVEERLSNLQSSSLDVLLLHTWTRAWNDKPVALEILQKMKSEGLIKHIGISTPEHDQNCVIQLMREGVIDVLQVIYNIFDQEPAAQILPVAMETGTGIIIRVAFDEGVLTGKYKGDEQFAHNDFRRYYFAGDRLMRGVKRTPGYPEPGAGPPEHSRLRPARPHTRHARPFTRTYLEPWILVWWEIELVEQTLSDLNGQQAPGFLKLNIPELPSSLPLQSDR
jgi:aryl-alcohol dehydrogenase-like predicted oxidoreductase